MILERIKGESEIDFIKRIVYGKLVDKTVDEDFTELSEIVFGEGNKFNSSEVRKRFYGIKRLLDLMESHKMDNVTDEDILNELELKKIELKKERKKIQTVNVEYNKMLRDQARYELIIDHVRDVIPRIEVPQFKELQLEEEDKQWILAMGDLHYDKMFQSLNNSYSIEELERRMNLLLSETIRTIQKEKISHINVLNLGDSFEGLLRISALKTMRVGLIESVIQFSRFMAEWISKLSTHVEVTYYHVKTSNHSNLRMFNTGRGELDEDLEILVVNYIKDILINNNRVEVVIPKNDFIDFQIFDYNIIASHGDSVKSVKSSIQDYSMLHRKFYDYCFMAHFHHSVEQTVAEGKDNDVEIIVVPSIIGSCNYSDSLFTGSKSSAKLFGFTKGKGRTDTKTFVLN